MGEVFVAGLGVISAIGHTTDECLAALESGRAGISGITHLPTVHRGSIPVAEVKLTNGELETRAAEAGWKNTGKSEVSRTALLSLLAAREALLDATREGWMGGWKGDEKGLRVGLVSANTVGGMDKSEVFFDALRKNPDAPRLRHFVQHECGAVTEWVADRLGIHEFVTTLSTACSSSANAIFFAARLIRQGHLDMVVAGGTDSLTKFTLNGFNSLMILDRQACKPFDEERNGLNLGEGAGYVVLVSERLARGGSGKAFGESGGTLFGQGAPKIYCRLSGWANANDAYHQTASSPEGTGPFLAMQGALARAGLSPAEIGYINLHGTGTQNNDLAEGTAISRLFGPAYPPMSSTKSFTGHTLGASGGIEAVFSALSARHGYVYPNLRLEKPIGVLPFAAARSAVRDPSIRHVLSNSFGFGGNCTSLIFSKVEDE